MDLSSILPVAGMAAGLVFLLGIDLHFFARGREPGFREGAVWSVGWLAVSLLAALFVLALADGEAAINYTTVYLIERSLSLDNLFVFIMLFAYFAVPVEQRARLLFWGIAAALALRGLAIASGVAVINAFEPVLYALAVALLVLAYRIFQGVQEKIDPEANVMVRAVRRVFPVTAGYHGKSWFTRSGGRRHATPMFLCLTAVVFADLAFAIDSIPAAFAITRDADVIWLGNIFALLGLRALFVLVEGLIRRFRYLDETIAVVLALIAVKLLTEDFVHIGPVLNLAIVAAAFAIGIVASLVADRRDPDAEAKRRQRALRTASKPSERERKLTQAK
jgi:tellurite resistance protein TerC